MKKIPKKMYFLYSTREKYPTFRVDLTELFSKGIVKKGHAIDWHMQRIEEGEAAVEVVNDNERVFIGSKSASSRLFSKVKNQLLGFFHDIRLFKIIKNNHYDFIQVRDKVFAGLIGRLAAKKSGVPFYYWMSFPYPEADLYRAKDFSTHFSWFMRVFYWFRGKISSFILYKLVLPKADFIFVQSDKMLQDVQKHGISEHKMMPVPMGISLSTLENYTSEPVEEERLLGKKVLIYLGTMVRIRRIDFLLDMLSEILESMPDTVLLLVGDAPSKDMAFLKKRAEQLGILENVIFTGFVPMEKGWSYILRSDVCLSPFRPSPILDSTSPTKVVEYLALGKPVVANTHPDQSKVLQESGAGYAVEYTARAFSEACIKILNDPKLGQAMGENGIKYVRDCRTYEVLSQRLELQYQSLLEK